MEQYVYKLKYKKTIDISCWKVRIQTPYNIDMDFTHIQELMNDNIKFLMGECLGVTNLWRNGRIKEIDIDKIENDFKNRVVVFNTNYKANIKQGFWEVEYLINKPVNIPNELIVKFLILFLAFIYILTSLNFNNISARNCIH